MSTNANSTIKLLKKYKSAGLFLFSFSLEGEIQLIKQQTIQQTFAEKARGLSVYIHSPINRTFGRNEIFFFFVLSLFFQISSFLFLKKMGDLFFKKTYVSDFTALLDWDLLREEHKEYLLKSYLAIPFSESYLAKHENFPKIKASTKIKKAANLVIDPICKAEEGYRATLLGNTDQSRKNGEALSQVSMNPSFDHTGQPLSQVSMNPSFDHTRQQALITPAGQVKALSNRQVLQLEGGEYSDKSNEEERSKKTLYHGGKTDGGLDKQQELTFQANDQGNDSNILTISKQIQNQPQFTKQPGERECPPALEVLPRGIASSDTRVLDLLDLLNRYKCKIDYSTEKALFTNVNGALVNHLGYYVKLDYSDYNFPAYADAENESEKIKTPKNSFEGIQASAVQLAAGGTNTSETHLNQKENLNGGSAETNGEKHGALTSLSQENANIQNQHEKQQTQIEEEDFSGSTSLKANKTVNQVAKQENDTPAATQQTKKQTKQAAEAEYLKKQKEQYPGSHYIWDEQYRGFELVEIDFNKHLYHTQEVKHMREKQRAKYLSNLGPHDQDLLNHENNSCMYNRSKDQQYNGASYGYYSATYQNHQGYNIREAHNQGFTGDNYQSRNIQSPFFQTVEKDPKTIQTPLFDQEKNFSRQSYEPRQDDESLDEQNQRENHAQKGAYQPLQTPAPLQQQTDKNGYYIESEDLYEEEKVLFCYKAFFLFLLSASFWIMFSLLRVNIMKGNERSCGLYINFLSVVNILVSLFSVFGPFKPFSLQESLSGINQEGFRTKIILVILMLAFSLGYETYFFFVSGMKISNLPIIAFDSISIFFFFVNIFNLRDKKVQMEEDDHRAANKKMTTCLTSRYKESKKRDEDLMRSRVQVQELNQELHGLQQKFQKLSKTSAPKQDQKIQTDPEQQEIATLKAQLEELNTQRVTELEIKSIAQKK